MKTSHPLRTVISVWALAALASMPFACRPADSPPPVAEESTENPPVGAAEKTSGEKIAGEADPQVLVGLDGPDDAGDFEEEGPPISAADPDAAARLQPTTPTELTAQAQIAFSKTTHDFGEIFDIREVKCEFEFKNIGDETLVISNIKPSCGCTTTSLKKRRYEPGESETIEVVYKPKGRNRQRNRINIVTNSAQGRVTQLNIVANIKQFVTLDPQYLRFGTVELGKNSSRKVKVASHDPDFIIESVRTVGPLLSATILQTQQGFEPVPEKDAGKSDTIEIMVQEDAPWGAFNTSVFVTCRGRTEPGAEEITHTARLGVNGSVYGRLHADKGLFRVGVVPPKGVFEEVIRLTQPEGDPFSVISITVRNSSMPGVTARAEPIDEDGVSGYKLILSGSAGSFLGTVTGYVDVVTDVPGEEKLEFKYAGMVRALLDRELKVR